MRRTVDSERALRIDLLGLIKERVINDSLTDVAFHVSAGLLFLLWVNQALDYFECSRVMQTWLLASTVLAAASDFGICIRCASVWIRLGLWLYCVSHISKFLRCF